MATIASGLGTAALTSNDIAAADRAASGQTGLEQVVKGARQQAESLRIAATSGYHTTCSVLSFAVFRLLPNFVSEPPCRG